MFIGIAGSIGAGKSTLARLLACELDLPLYEEPGVDGDYLVDFYRDMARYAFSMQVYLLNKRFSQHQQIIWSERGGVQDRTIYEDSVFAKYLHDGGFMEARDYKTYVDLFNVMSNFMRRPNVIVYLDVTPEESARRIGIGAEDEDEAEAGGGGGSRARKCESTISLEYLQALYVAYNEFIADISRAIPVIKIKVDDSRSTEEMVHHIVEEYNRIGTVRLIEWSLPPPSSRPRHGHVVTSARAGAGAGDGAGDGGGEGEEGMLSDAAELTRFALAALMVQDRQLAVERLEAALCLLSRSRTTRQ